MTGPAEFDAALARDNPEELLHLAISLSMDPPEDEHPGQAERICRSLARHAHPNVRGNAILGFGHLARTAGIIWKPVEVRALVETGSPTSILMCAARPKPPLATSATSSNGS